MSRVRFFSFPDPEAGVITMSTDEIREQYWDHWRSRMKERGKWRDDMTFDDCLDDWVVVNWAWEVED